MEARISHTPQSFLMIYFQHNTNSFIIAERFFLWGHGHVVVVIGGAHLKCELQ
jgi:hypothetical protein